MKKTYRVLHESQEFLKKIAQRFNCNELERFILLKMIDDVDIIGWTNTDEKKVLVNKFFGSLSVDEQEKAKNFIRAALNLN